MWHNFRKGIFEDNPVFILALGLCPTLAVTTSAINGIGMGLATTFVLLCSNILVSSIRHLVPDEVRIPVFIIIIASFVTLVRLIMQAYFPALYDALGIFVSLIVVNCMILGRAEGFAKKHGILDSFIDGLGMGTGFTLALFTIGGVREILGANQLFGMLVVPGFEPANFFILAPGAFLVMGLLMAGFKIMLERKLNK